MPRHGTILLVENDANDIFLIRRALSQAGVTNALHVVQTGSEAIAYLDGEGKHTDRQAHPLPFLLLADLNMPGGDAFAILRWLADRPALKKKIIVVVLSSICSESEIDELYELGAKSFLLKPTTYEQLLEVVRKIKEFWIDTAITPET